MAILTAAYEERRSFYAFGGLNGKGGSGEASVVAALVCHVP